MAWKWQQGRNLTYLTIPEWEQEGIQIGFSTRWGGVSQSPYSSLNLGFHVGDDPEAVRINRERWLKEWKAGWSEVALGEQVHGTRVHVVTEADAGCGSQSLDTVIRGVDALVTTSTLGLMAFFADCVPVFFYHPKLQAVAIAHAGWKGTAGKIVQNTLEQFRLLGGNPSECWAALGPSIGPCCYEVDERVLRGFFEGFIKSFPKSFPKELDIDFKDYFQELPFFKPSKPGHALLDLWEGNQVVLREAGVRPENIWVAGICTSCHTDSFFSHRKEGAKTGRMAGWIRRTPRREG